MPTRTGQPHSLMDDGNFLLELDKIGTGPAPREQAPRPATSAPHPRVAAAGRPNHTEPREPLDDDDDELPPAAFVRTESGSRATAFDAAEANADKELIPSSLAALVILLCMCVGASGAALVLHERVQHIVAAWRVAAR